MRRLLAILCCLVLATTLVARGGTAGCPAGSCCEPVKVAPATAPADEDASCCQPTSKPTPKDHTAAAHGEMACCAVVAWYASPRVSPIAPAEPSRDRLQFDDAGAITHTLEPATPPPRATIG